MEANLSLQRIDISWVGEREALHQDLLWVPK
jgi:hypothetical protein